MKTKLYGGINENPDGTFSITPYMPFGRLDVNQLEAVFNVVQRFNLPGVQANTAQRIVIDGIPADSASLWRFLMSVFLSVFNISVLIDTSLLAAKLFITHMKENASIFSRKDQ